MLEPHWTVDGRIIYGEIPDDENVHLYYAASYADLFHKSIPKKGNWINTVYWEGKEYGVISGLQVPSESFYRAYIIQSGEVVGTVPVVKTPYLGSPIFTSFDNRESTIFVLDKNEILVKRMWATSKYGDNGWKYTYHCSTGNLGEKTIYKLLQINIKKKYKIYIEMADEHNKYWCLLSPDGLIPEIVKTKQIKESKVVEKKTQPKKPAKAAPSKEQRSNKQSDSNDKIPLIIIGFLIGFFIMGIIMGIIFYKKTSK